MPGRTPKDETNEGGRRCLSESEDDSIPEITIEDIKEAAKRINSYIVRTDLVRSHIEEDGIQIFLKKEFNQYTGSFKERGARNALVTLSKKAKRRGVIAASAGNHALGLSYHGKLLGIPVTVVMPTTSPIMKREVNQKLGANVIIHGEHFQESLTHALSISKKEKLTYIHGFTTLEELEQKLN